MIQIMAVDRADIVEAQLLEQRAARPEAAGIFLARAARRPPSSSAILGHLLGQAARKGDRCCLKIRRAR